MGEADGFHNGDFALKHELGVHVKPHDEKHGDDAARVHDDVLVTCGGQAATEQWRHLADLDDGQRSVMPASASVHSIFCWHSSRIVRSGHSFQHSPLDFLNEFPSARMYF